MIGEDDTAIFLNSDEFAELVTLPNNAVVRGIFDIDDDPQFSGLMEGRDPSLLISTADYAANGLRHRDVLIIQLRVYVIESVEPYGADRAYTVIKLRES